MTQKEMMTTYLPMIEMRGKMYAKKTKVKARPAREGEKIDTITSDGKETTNTAKEGDWVVQNLTKAGEVYILPEKKFKARYEFLNKWNNDWDYFKALGKCMAMRYYGENFEFMAPWNEKMVVKDRDMLCTPIPEENEIYRIAAKEFGETYGPE